MTFRSFNSHKYCTCTNPDDQYMMEIVGGDVAFTHVACGKWPGTWADDSFEMTPVPVTLHWHALTDPFNGDVDAYGDITINGLPMTVPPVGRS